MPYSTFISPESGQKSGLFSARLLRSSRLGAVSLCLSLMALTLQPSLAQQMGGFPNGASSLQEKYEDWMLSCAARDNAPICVVSQDQLQQNGQRLLAVEIAMRSDSAVATLLLPFGILLDSGVTPQIDDQAPLTPVRFRTCLPNGCIARFNVDPAALEKLRTGTSLKLQVTTDAETPLTFPVSLKGLTAALDRLRNLNGS